eukprot:EG_transcript_26220
MPFPPYIILSRLRGCTVIRSGLARSTFVSKNRFFWNSLGHYCSFNLCIRFDPGSGQEPGGSSQTAPPGRVGPDSFRRKTPKAFENGVQNGQKLTFFGHFFDFQLQIWLKESDSTGFGFLPVFFGVP